ncbi:MAG: hypothetical protein M3243_00075 [Thermoproteota archaeon]|nr:hypothetical protein [Thermoproteota archaeon]MDQ3882434.1 hypothetical protein [Thermoproteota archaeon]
MPDQHGDYDPKQRKWFCSYWMSQEEWLDIHNYAVPAMLQHREKEPAAKENDDYDKE